MGGVSEPEQRALIAQLPELFLSTVINTLPLAEGLLLGIDDAVSPHKDRGRDNSNV